jgi:uncharacterized protein (DUF433 family)
MDWSGCEAVEIVPGKVSGFPVMRRSRVLADQVLENHVAGESVEDIAYNFDLRPEDIRVVVSHAGGRPRS